MAEIQFATETVDATFFLLLNLLGLNLKTYTSIIPYVSDLKSTVMVYRGKTTRTNVSSLKN